MIGKVYLIGAGPGDYKLLTLKGKECLEKADVIVYDRLANEAYLGLGKASCEYINVGEASSNHTLPQDEINELLAVKAKEGKIVARLKGGDPYVFGRGGEEGEYLFERGIPFEVVPGVTSAIGGLCYAGIPITHRDCASSFHVITGHLKEGSKDSINWDALVGLNGTLVFLMGIGNLEQITKNLLAAGKDKETPVGLVSWATRYNQSVVTGTLETIYEKALAHQVKPPTLIVVGEVVNLREKLNFFENMPLFGKQIVVTRTRKQSSQLVEAIRDLGGSPLEFPTIEIAPIKENDKLIAAFKELSKYTHLVLTSPNGVEVFFDALEAEGKDARALAHLKIAVIGEATRKALKQRGISADIMPEKAVAESLVDCLEKELTAEDYVLLPHSALSREVLVSRLQDICKVEDIPTYETLPVEDSSEEVGYIGREALLGKLAEGAIDYITFTSSSTVHHLVERIGKDQLAILEQTQLISIGEVTTKTLESYGLKVAGQAKKASVTELIACLQGK